MVKASDSEMVVANWLVVGMGKLAGGELQCYHSDID